MKAAFFHDHRFIIGEESGTIMTRTSFTYEMFRRRYLRHFEQLTVIGRGERAAPHDRKRMLSISSGKDVNCRTIPNLRGALLGKGRKIIKQSVAECDVAIIRLPSIIGQVAVHEAVVAKKDFIIELVACPFDGMWNKGGVIAKGFAIAQYLITRHIVRRSNHVAYVTKEFLQRRYPNNKHNIGCSDVIISAVDKLVLQRRTDKIRQRGSRKVIKIGLVGSLDVNIKGHSTAIKCLSELTRRSGRRYELHFLGQGDKARWVELATKYGVKEKVFFDGVLPSGKMVCRWLDQLDIFIMPSKQEALPRSMIEAMSRGVPCIGSHIGGIPELIDCMVIPGDSTGLANEITRILSDKKVESSIAKQNFRKGAQYYSSKLENSLGQFFSDVIYSVERG